MKRRFSTTITMAAMLALAGPVTAADTAAQSVTVSNAHVRAVPEGQPASAAFMTLHNGGLTHHSLVSAKSPVAEVVELHTHVDEDGMMKMRQIPKIIINPGSDTVLKPGSLHIMLMKLKQGLSAGEQVSVTLVFEDGSEQEVQAPVKAMQTMMKDHGKMQH